MGSWGLGNSEDIRKMDQEGWGRGGVKSLMWKRAFAGIFLEKGDFELGTYLGS